jgi:hypothetical protein
MFKKIIHTPSELGDHYNLSLFYSNVICYVGFHDQHTDDMIYISLVVVDEETHEVIYSDCYFGKYTHYNNHLDIAKALIMKHVKIECEAELDDIEHSFNPLKNERLR